MEIRFQPSLSACIETVAKREYERVLRLLLKGAGETPALEQRLELLRVFLESADFRRLRSLSEPLLVAGRQVEFILRSTSSAPGHEIEMKAGEPSPSSGEK